MVDVLADKMKEMMSDGILRNKIARNSLELAMTKFNIESINKEIGLLYEKLSAM